METIINILGWITFVSLIIVALSVLFLAVRDWYLDWKHYGGKIRFQMWFARWFLIITEEQAKEWGLTFSRNVYGDEINMLDGARSIWLDQDKNVYRVAEYIAPENIESLRKPPFWDKLMEKHKGQTKNRCPICHYETNGEGHRCILNNEQI